jgi:hypothetical protein
MPEVDGVLLLSSETTHIRAKTSGQYSQGAIPIASEQKPSSSESISHVTDPPKSEQQAEPELWWAMKEY